MPNHLVNPSALTEAKPLNINEIGPYYPAEQLLKELKVAWRDELSYEQLGIS